MKGENKLTLYSGKFSIQPVISLKFFSASGLMRSLSSFILSARFSDESVSDGFFGVDVVGRFRKQHNVDEEKDLCLKKEFKRLYSLAHFGSSFLIFFSLRKTHFEPSKSKLKSRPSISTFLVQDDLRLS